MRNSDYEVRGRLRNTQTSKLCKIIWFVCEQGLASLSSILAESEICCQEFCITGPMTRLSIKQLTINDPV